MQLERVQLNESRAQRGIASVIRLRKFTLQCICWLLLTTAKKVNVYVPLYTCISMHLDAIVHWVTQMGAFVIMHLNGSDRYSPLGYTNNDKVKRPEGPQARSQGRRAPKTSS